MAKVHEHITDDFKTWIEAQPMFFVASAPLSADGHVNLSPKGMDCLRVLDEHTVAYLDLTGSGNETSAHLRENGRITLMWCAFEGPPRILRLYGRGRIVLPDTPEWDELAPLFTLMPGARQIVVNEVMRVQTSCGFAVPLMTYESDRDTLIKYAENKGPDGMVDYRKEKNMTSIDGLPTAFCE
ncbi:MAG: pyridoxamine 5'-phosphate oxidase family protein [Chloroflexota bacterium]